MNKYIIGITGASGSVLTKRLLEYLAQIECELNIVATENGEKVFRYETDTELSEFAKRFSESSASRLVLHSDGDLFAQIASGSYTVDSMLILPCSMSTIGKIANGTGGGLLVRAADVCIKEKTRLVICPRETPFNSIHLKNMLTLSENGVTIVPPMPMFYTKSESLDDVYDGIVGRILKSAGIENRLYKKWREE